MRKSYSTVLWAAANAAGGGTWHGGHPRAKQGDGGGDSHSHVIVIAAHENDEALSDVRLAKEEDLSTPSSSTFLHCVTLPCSNKLKSNQFFLGYKKF